MSKKLRIAGFILFFMGCIAIIITADEPLDVYQVRPMPPLTLNALDGGEISTAKWALETPGPKIINLFATWCGPCAAEMPVLMALAERDIAPIYGIAWRDSPEDIEQWLKTHGNPFAEVGIDKAFTFMFDLGIRGVPTTLVLDESQRIVYIHQGTISMDDVETIIIPKINSLRQKPAL